MTDLFYPTPTNAARPSLTTEDQDQQARGGGVRGVASPTGRVLDFADITERPEPVRVDYKPGEATCVWREHRGASLDWILRNACIDLELDPGDLSAAPHATRSGWLMADREDAATGALVSRRVALVQGLSVHWLKIGLRQLLFSGWTRPLPPAPTPPGEQPD